MPWVRTINPHKFFTYFSFIYGYVVYVTKGKQLNMQVNAGRYNVLLSYSVRI